MPRWLTGAIVLAALQTSVAADQQFNCNWGLGYRQCCQHEHCKWVDERYTIFGQVFPGCGFAKNFAGQDHQPNMCPCDTLRWDDCCDNANFERCKWTDVECVDHEDDWTNNECLYNRCLNYRLSTHQDECCNEDDENKMCGWSGQCITDTTGEKSGCPEGL